MKLMLLRLLLLLPGRLVSRFSSSLLGARPLTLALPAQGALQGSGRVHSAQLAAPSTAHSGVELSGQPRDALATHNADAAVFLIPRVPAAHQAGATLVLPSGVEHAMNQALLAAGLG